MLRTLIAFLLLVNFFANMSVDVSAETTSVTDSHSKARLISEVSSIKAGKQFWLALELDPIDGWHTYWENPGDSGQKTIFDWGSVEGLSFGKAYYPSPERLPVKPLLNFGYHKRSVLLVPVTPAIDMKADRATIRLSAEWLVCEIECIPQYGKFEITLPVGDGLADAEQASLFAQARKALPEPPIFDAEIAINESMSVLTVFMSDLEVESVQNAFFYPKQSGVLEYAAPQIVEISENGLLIRAGRYKGDPIPEAVSGVLSIEQVGGNFRSVEIGLSPVKELLAGSAIGGPTGIATASGRNAAEQMHWLVAASFAFLGGLILNLMPCVFPVLSLKAFSFMQSAGQSASERHQEGWAYTFGILSSFMVIVGVLILLRESGEAVGWGFQLQNPVFLAIMVLVMLLLGLSMSGMFEIITGLEGTGQGLAGQGGNKGAFFTGVLTTLVATPCSAPFMAPAIGAALIQPIPIMLLIFIMLGFGLAFPFLLLSYSPWIASRLPRPGAWMDTLKQGLAFPIYLTGVWLLWVFTNIAGADAAFQLSAAAIILVFAIWLGKRGTGILLKASAVAFAALGLYFTVDSGLNITPKIDAGGDDQNGILSFSEKKLASVIGGERPVFAYFTADWCITCKVNERVALFQDETQAHFKALNVQVVKGDWTNKNAEIASLLERYGRAGVPLYLYFPAGSKQAKVLPEVLTIGLLKEAVS